MIINFYEGNDYFDPIDNLPAPKSIMKHPWTLLPAGLSLGAIRDWLYPLNQMAESHSQAYVGLRQFVRVSQDRMGMGMAALAFVMRPQLMTTKLNNSAADGIERVFKLANDAGKPTLLVFIPLMANVLATSVEQIKQAYPENGDDVGLQLSKRVFLPRVAAIDGLEMVDLTVPMRKLRRRSLWGTYDRHFSPEGHKVWFNATRSKVRAMLTVKP